MPPDPEVAAVLAASQITFDSGSSAERRLTGDSAREYLAQFERDTFQPGPNKVRFVHGCTGGSITVGRRSYPFSLCTVKGGGARVLNVAYGTDIVRLISRSTP